MHHAIDVDDNIHQVEPCFNLYNSAGFALIRASILVLLAVWPRCGRHPAIKSNVFSKRSAYKSMIRAIRRS
eukprot:10287879-Karenia_brevis.AAC.1